jgi:divalent metal cation (Fe/Co/Zn/Cd) transporter
MLIGEAAAPQTVAAIRSALHGAPHVTSVIHMRTLHLGPDELLVAAKVALAENLTVTGVATAINEAEKLVRAAVPAKALIYIEPDIPHVQPPAQAPAPAEPVQPRHTGP